MPNSFAIFAAKTAGKINKITGSGGTALPGLVAKKLSGNILGDLTRKNFPKGIILVTGTNGKTTTSRFVASILQESGTTYLHNRAGSNLERGLIATVVEKTNLQGKIDAQMAVFEVDEAYVPMVAKQINPDYVVVTNLFRDQLDRYGELDSIAQSFKKTFAELKNTHFILNADDPLVASIGLEIEDKTKLHYFGVEGYNGQKLEHDHTADSIFSPISGQPLQYSQQYFSHLGVYQSKNGDFKRPKPEYQAKNIIESASSGVSFDVNTTTKAISLPLKGLYSVYNALAAYAVGEVIGIGSQQIKKALESSAAAFGRAEEISYNDKKWLLLLIKNPTGFNQIIQTYLLESQKDTLWIIINDNFADGRDVSWLWDAAIEDISAYQGKVMVSGTRAYDMALRLKYAGLEGFEVEPDIEKALGSLDVSTGKRQRILVLPTYTAMRQLRAELVKEAGIAKEHLQ